MSACDVVIVNYNAGELLDRCVDSALPGARCVIVVDNASTDGSIERLARRFAGNDALRVIRNPGNLGFAAACNRGARTSDAAQLLFLNPDCVLDPAALERLRAVLDSAPDIGMTGGLLCSPDGTEQPGGRRRMPTPGRAFVQAFGLTRLLPALREQGLSTGAPLPAEPVAVEAISGACMLVKRAAIEDVGLWDEGYFLHCEDLDWCARFQQLGWRIMFVPDARVTHAWGGCSSSRPTFVEWHKHRGMIRYYRKFHKDHYPVVLWPLVVFGVWLRFGLVSVRHALRGRVRR